MKNRKILILLLLMLTGIIISCETDDSVSNDSSNKDNSKEFVPEIEGAYVVGIGPSSLDDITPHSRLIDIADVGFDNFSPESGGVIKIKGREDTICPTSGIVGNVVQQMICAQWTDEMVRRGSIPYYWMGFFQVGGREYDDGVRPFFEIQGF